MIQQWIVEGTAYQQSTIPLERTYADYHRPFNIAYFCPLCGNIWARRIVTGASVDSEWALWHRPCSKHPSSLSRGASGSVWLGFNTDSDRNLPRPLLEKEFLLALQQQESAS